MGRWMVGKSGASKNRLGSVAVGGNRKVGK